MSNQKLPPFKLSASYLGPVFELESELTKHAQNLIFARNGTGKSFLSRAFRCFDLHQQGGDLSEAAIDLVSEESPDAASLSFYRGTTALGELTLSKKTGTTTATITNTIFHVFSEDFVSAELRERDYKIDGNIKNEIAVDSENIQIKEASMKLEAVESELEEKRSKLVEEFEMGKVSELVFAT